MSGIHRFLSRRDRHQRQKTSKEETSAVLSRPLFRGLFASKATPEEGLDHFQKVKILEQRIRAVGIAGLNDEHFSYALFSTAGDVDKAFELLILLEDSIEGVIRSYSPKIKLLGAENRKNVTCYLDALLFAMFARLDCFEGILYKSFNDEPRQKLVTLLRFWVNLLRSGKLITTDITEYLQGALSECGWKDALNVRQQDASEAFTFITGKLELPLLTLKMDIYHVGKEDVSDDHKFINERLLEVAIPPPPTDGRTLTLEDCLEAYFNNKIEVKRYLERHHTLESQKSADSLSKGFTAHVETVEVDPSPTMTPARSASPRPEKVTPWSLLAQVSEGRVSSRGLTRRDSIVRERFIPDSKDENADGPDTNESGSSPRKGVYRKEVMMPAWQFFSLIPWYTDNTPTNDAQVAAHFSSKRPILGMCLKRYSFLPNGTAIRLNTLIDIPIEIGLPSFIQDDNLDANSRIYGNFKLSLQSLVCHRGNSVGSGHYIAIVRGTSENSVPIAEGRCMPSESSNYWMRFDDLADERVTLVDIDVALRTESPYLLFYQILPIDEDAGATNLQTAAPSSRASNATLDSEIGDIARKLLALASSNNTDESSVEEVASGRPSVEITGPDSPGPVTTNPARRPSVAFSEPGHADASKPRSAPSTSPRLAPMEEQVSKGSLTFSRRSSRLTKSNSGSRAGSQSGENRIGATFSRFAGRLSRERVAGEETENEAEESAMETDDAAEGRVRGRPKLRERNKAISKAKSREKSRGLERECVVM